MQLFINILIGLTAGVLIGGFFFGALYVTAQKLLQSSHPTLLMLISFIIRIAVTLGVFYFLIKGGHLIRFFAGLLGFIGFRVFLINKVKPDTMKKQTGKEG